MKITVRRAWFFAAIIAGLAFASECTGKHASASAQQGDEIMITFTVITTNNKPVSSAEIVISDTIHIKKMRTNDNGIARMYLTPGLKYGTVTAKGFEDKTIEAFRASHQAGIAITLKPN